MDKNQIIKLMCGAVRTEVMTAERRIETLKTGAGELPYSELVSMGKIGDIENNLGRISQWMEAIQEVQSLITG